MQSKPSVMAFWPKKAKITACDLLFFFFFNQLLSSVSSPRVASLGAGSVPCGLSSSLGSCATEGGRGLCLCAWFMCGLESSAAETSFVGSFGHSAYFPEPLQK